MNGNEDRQKVSFVYFLRKLIKSITCQFLLVSFGYILVTITHTCTPTSWQVMLGEPSVSVLWQKIPLTIEERVKQCQGTAFYYLPFTNKDMES